MKANVYRLTPDHRYPDSVPDITVVRRDATKAVPNSPLSCTIANAGRRTTKALAVIVLRTKAMFVFREPTGHYYVEHYELGPISHTVMAATDRHKTGLGVGVKLDFRPVRPSMRPGAHSLRNKARPGGRAVNPGSRPNTGRRPDPLTAMGVRKGSPSDWLLHVPSLEPVPEVIPLKKPWQSGHTGGQASS